MIYHLEVEARYCQVDVLVNGFPLFNFNGDKPGVFSKPINAFLIENNNIIAFTIKNAQFLKTGIDFSLVATIKRYEVGQMTGPSQGTVVCTQDFKNLLVGSITFDNEFFNYSKLLQKGTVIDDNELLVDYGIMLKSFLEKGDVSAILEEFDYKMSDFAIAYSLKKEDLVIQLSQYLREKYFSNMPELNFERHQISLRPWCEKKIWEIGVGATCREFMVSHSVEHQAEYSTKIFVALIANKIRVVR